jgi:predicted RNase H-like nuclease (RuvC/YqgF family)
MQDQMERQASATLAANRKNKELEDEIVKLKEKLVNQEAESDRKLEEKMQRFKEEESLKLQAFKDELMAAVQGGRQTPTAQVKKIGCR